MLVPCPCKFEHTEKYPQKYAVSPLLPSEQTIQAPKAKPQGKHKCPKGKLPNNQSTMERFISPGGPQGANAGMHTDFENADATATPNLDPTQFYIPDFGQEPLSRT